MDSERRSPIRRRRMIEVDGTVYELHVESDGTEQAVMVLRQPAGRKRSHLIYKATLRR